MVPVLNSIGTDCACVGVRVSPFLPVLAVAMTDGAHAMLAEPRL